MPKVELTLTDAEKAMLQRAADLSQLRLATWAKAVLKLHAMERAKGDWRDHSTKTEDGYNG